MKSAMNDRCPSQVLRGARPLRRRPITTDLRTGAPAPGGTGLHALGSGALARAGVLFIALVLSLPAGALAQPEIAFSETEHDFGQVDEGAVLSHVFGFTNSGDAPLKIWEVESPCECTVPHLSQESIDAGRTGEVVVTFDSERLSGSITKEIFVRSNDPLQSEVRLRLHASVRPGLVVEPANVNLGKVPRQGGTSATVRLIARDDTPFEIKEVHLGLDFLGAQVVAAAGDGASTTAAVQVTAAKGGSPGPFVDFLVITTTHPRREKIEIPVNGEVESLFRIEPPRLTFGTAKPEGQRLGEVTITYTGTEEVNLLGVASSAPSLRTELKPYPTGEGGRVSIYLTGEAAVGRLAETVTVTTDSADEPTLSIRVVGYVRK